MSWVQTGVSSHSLLRKTAAIGAILLKSAMHQVGSSLLLTVALLSGSMATFSLLALCFYLLEKYFGQFEVMSSIVAILLFAAAICVWLLLGWQVAKWKTRTETTMWRAQRLLKQVHPEYHAWLQRARKWSLLVPCAIALPILLFFPETCAITSHIFNSRAGQLNQYRLQIPMTWLIVNSSADNGSGFSYVGTWTTRGLMRSWQFEPLMSAARFGNAAFGVRRMGIQLPERATILSTKTFSVAGEPFTCWEYLYPVHHAPPGTIDLLIVRLLTEDSRPGLVVNSGTYLTFTRYSIV